MMVTHVQIVGGASGVWHVQQDFAMPCWTLEQVIIMEYNFITKSYTAC
jgi:hypothetical protein